MAALRFKWLYFSVGTRIDEVFWSVGSDLSRDLPMFFGNSINICAHSGESGGCIPAIIKQHPPNIFHGSGKFPI